MRRRISRLIGGAWNISRAQFVRRLSTSAQMSSPRGITFKPDGTEMYLTDGTDQDVSQYTLSTAWDISSASYVRAFSTSGQETTPQGIFFKPDGTIMYIVGTAGDGIDEYALSTAWDISTASHTSFASAFQNATAIFIKPDGLTAYVSDFSDVLTLPFSTAWDSSTRSFGSSFDPVASTITGVFFKPDGTKLYLASYGGGAVFTEYDLSTSWDIGTASLNASLDIDSIAGTPRGIFISDDGLNLYCADSSENEVNQFLMR